MKKFAFLVHPREIADFGRVIGKKIGIVEEMGMKLLPGRPTDWLIQRLNGRYGFSICSHFNVCNEVEGYIIIVLLTARQMLELPRKYVVGRIMDAILYAQ